MGEGTETAPLVEGRLDEIIARRAIAAAETASPAERVRAGLEAVVEFAEIDPAAARVALLELRADHEALRRLEGCLPGGEEQATLALGAAIRVALAELRSAVPDLRGRIPEMSRWLEGGW